VSLPNGFTGLSTAIPLAEESSPGLFCRNKSKRKEKTRFFVIGIAYFNRQSKLNNTKTRP
jgi:hypothetical protein